MAKAKLKRSDIQVRIEYRKQPETAAVPALYRAFELLLPGVGLSGRRPR